MMTVDQQFTALAEKVQQLVQRHQRLQRENEKLKEDLEQARKREAAMRARGEELLQQVAILKMAAGEMSEGDKKTFERKLNQYIKEIDKAIAYLSE
jgi:regulator of replication initiation timing